jgi:hypothetical protein
MNLTKNVKGKNAKKHIGEPSFIISMGKSRVEGKFLEVRVGVEENYLSELSDNGSIFLRNLILKKKDVIAKLQSLSADWSLSHGVYTINKMTTISANKINENSLVDICNYYLQTREAADLCIRKFYYVEQDKCAKEIFNPLVTRTISKDFETLKFFFDLSF